MYCKSKTHKSYSDRLISMLKIFYDLADSRTSHFVDELSSYHKDDEHFIQVNHVTKDTDQNDKPCILELTTGHFSHGSEKNLDSFELPDKFKVRDFWFSGTSTYIIMLMWALLYTTLSVLAVPMYSPVAGFILGVILLFSLPILYVIKMWILTMYIETKCGLIKKDISMYHEYLTKKGKLLGWMDTTNWFDSLDRMSHKELNELYLKYKKGD